MRPLDPELASWLDGARLPDGRYRVEQLLARWLLGRGHNRAPIKPKMEHYRALLDSGVQLADNPILLRPDGRIVNGLHRLAAIAQSTCNGIALRIEFTERT